MTPFINDSTIKILRIGLIGIGHIFDYYYVALKHNKSTFFISGIYDTRSIRTESYRHLPLCNSIDQLIATKPDIVAILCPSATRYEVAKNIIMHKIPVILEKPQTKTIQQYDDLVRLSIKNKIFIFGAFHSRYTTTHMFVRNNMAVDKEGTFHTDFGKLKKIELNRFDPYLNKTNLPERTSGLDSWPNILAELALFVDEYYVLEVLNLSDSFLHNNMEVKSEIRGNFTGGGTFIGRTDWTKGINNKTTILQFDKGTITMEHTLQKVLIESGTGGIHKADFSCLGDRMVLEYFRMLQEVYDVYHGIMDSNETLTRKILSNTLECAYKIQTAYPWSEQGQ